MNTCMKVRVFLYNRYKKSQNNFKFIHKKFYYVRNSLDISGIKILKHNIMTYTSRYFDITLDQALEKIQEKGYRFECYSTLEHNTVHHLLGTVNCLSFLDSYLGVSKGNGVWHWYEIQESKSKKFGDDIFGNGLEYSHSYSQNTGQTFKRNQDYIKTALNIFK